MGERIAYYSSHTYIHTHTHTFTHTPPHTFTLFGREEDEGESYGSQGSDIGSKGALGWDLEFAT